MGIGWPMFLLIYGIATWSGGAATAWFLFLERHRWGPGRLTVAYAGVLLAPFLLFPAIATRLEGSFLPAICRTLRHDDCDVLEQVLSAQIGIFERGWYLPLSYVLLVLAFTGGAILRGTGPTR